MNFRKPTQEEIEAYKVFISVGGFVMQTVCALFFIVMIILVWTVGEKRNVGDIIFYILFSLVLLWNDKRFIRYAIRTYIENKCYKQGSYDVCVIDFDLKKVGSRMVGGSSGSTHISTYKIPEIDERIDIDGCSYKKIIHDQKAALIRISAGKKAIYYITHVV